MEMYQDGVPVYVLPDGAICKADEYKRSPLDIDNCPLGNEICDKCLTCHWYCDDVLEECKGQEEPCHEYSPCMEIRRVGEQNE